MQTWKTLRNKSAQQKKKVKDYTSLPAASKFIPWPLMKSKSFLESFLQPRTFVETINLASHLF